MTSTSAASSSSRASCQRATSTIRTPSASGTVSTTLGCGRTSRTWSSRSSARTSSSSICRSSWYGPGACSRSGRWVGAKSRSCAPAATPSRSRTVDAMPARVGVVGGEEVVAGQPQRLHRDLAAEGAAPGGLADSGPLASRTSHWAASRRTRSSQPRPIRLPACSSSRPTTVDRAAVPGLQHPLAAGLGEVRRAAVVRGDHVARPSRGLVPVVAEAGHGAHALGKHGLPVDDAPQHVEAGVAPGQLLVQGAGVVAVGTERVGVEEHHVASRQPQERRGTPRSAGVAGRRASSR